MDGKAVTPAKGSHIVDRVRPFVTGTTVLLIGCAITLFAFLDVRRQHLRQLDDEFQDEATEIYQLLQRTIDLHIDALNSLSGLFSASVVVTEEEFQTFLAPALERQPHIHLLGWAPRVGGDEARPNAELQSPGGVANSDPDSSEQSATRPGRDLFPIVFGGPLPETGLIRGFDLAGEVVFRTAMAWARDSGLPTASRPVDLTDDGEVSRGILIFCPLFERGSDPIDYVERREALTGFVVMALRIDAMVDWAVENLPELDVDIRLRDIGMPPAKSFLYFFDAERGEDLAAVPATFGDDRFRFDRTPLQIATRAWDAEFAPTDRFIGRFATLQPAIVLIVGLLLSGLLALYAQREARQTERIKALVQSRTTALEEEVEKRRAAQDALKHRVEELEETRDRLERQGEQLAEFARDLSRARDKADAANAAKSAFLATMSHELRTPLNAIIGFSELIRDELAGEIGDRKYCDYARDIHASGQHLLALINDILDVSKAEAGKLEINDEIVDVAEAVRSCIRLCQTRADSIGADLIERVPDDLPLLRADRRRLKQILINLITNAIKFTGGSGTVTIQGFVDKAGWMVVEVRDSGIGMTEREIDKALEPFGQVDTAINRKHPGTGLGLPLTKSMVEVHGGRLVIESKVGQGTLVRALFPSQRVVHDRSMLDDGGKRAAGGGHAD